MAIFLEVISGSNIGLKFEAKAGLKIGRSLGDVHIDDPRLSALHASIKSSEKGRLFLVDRESSNGIKVNGKRVDKVLLTPGASLQIGSTILIVLEEAAAEELDLNVPIDPVPELSWQDLIRRELPSLGLRNLKPETEPVVFKQVFSLRVIEGYQQDQEFVLPYGPRSFGLACLDFELIDPLAPPLAFQIYPNADGDPVFKTDHAESVHLNGISSPTENLQNGDIIRVGSTLIEVRISGDQGNTRN